MCIPNRPVVDIPEVGPAFPFVSLVLFAGCSLDGWWIGKESSVFRLSPLPAHKPVWAWGTLVMGCMSQAYLDRLSPLASSQTGMGSGYSWSLYPNSLVDVSSRNRGSGTLSNVMN